VSDRSDRLQQAFAALARGDADGIRDLFAERAQWLGVPGSGFDGDTPI
jgi:ketosteroid isomerase-like protein